MKKALIEIKHGQGLGVLKFGMRKSEVKLLLGEPSFIDEYSHSDSANDLTESWEYDDLALSISFDEEENWKLTMISVSADFYQLEGESLIGLNEENVITALTSLKFEDLELEDCSEIDGENHKVIEVEAQSINFWFIDGVLDEIQWSPLFIDDDTIQWPA